MLRRKSFEEALLGKEFARKEVSTTRITDWSPNNIKTLVFGWNYLFVEYHVIDKYTKKHNVTEKVRVHKFKDKETESWEHKPNFIKLIEEPRLLSAVEEIYFLQTADYPQDIFNQDMRDFQTFLSDSKLKTRFPRLYAAGCIRDTVQNVQNVLKTGKNKHLHYANNFKSKKLMYTNQHDWWRYGVTGYAPLRPKYYTMDAHPETVDGECLPEMALHRCFTNIAKPFYETESTRENADKQLMQQVGMVGRLNKQYADLLPVLEVMLPAIAINDIFYSFNRARLRNKAWDTPRAKVKSIAEAVRVISIYKEAKQPKNFQDWAQTHSKVTNDYGDDALYDTYKENYVKKLTHLQKLLNDSTYYNEELFGDFTELLYLLSYVLYTLIIPTKETTPAKYSTAKMNAAMFTPDCSTYQQFKKNHVVGLQKSKDISYVEKYDLINFVYELCSNICYAAVLSEFDTLHVYVNARMNNTNILAPQILFETGFYDTAKSKEMPINLMYYDTFLCNLASELPGLASAPNADKNKTVLEYIKNIGVTRYDVTADKLSVTHITERLNENVSIQQKIIGLQCLNNLVQYVLVSESVGYLMPDNNAWCDLYNKYKSNWYKMPRTEFRVLVERGRTAFSESNTAQ